MEALLKNIPEIPESKLDSSVQSKLNTGGSGNSNVTIPTTTTEITNAATDYLVIQDTITLTANFTAPTGQTWHFTTGAINKNGFDITLDGVELIFNKDRVAFYGEGDVLGTPTLTAKEFYASNFGIVSHGLDLETASATSGSNIVNVTGANFDDSYIGGFISIKGANSGFSEGLKGQQSFSSTITAVNSPTQIVMADNATRTVTDALIWSGKDQHNLLDNLFSLHNRIGGRIIFSKGLHYFSVNERVNEEAGLSEPNANFNLGFNNDLIYEAHGAIFAVIPHNWQKTRAFNLKDAKRTTFEGGIYKGDLLMHNYSGLPVADQGDDLNVLFDVSSFTFDTTFKNVTLQQVSGTLMTGTQDYKFQNYIKGSNAANAGQAFTDVTLGTVDRITGIVTPDGSSDRYYTTDLIPVNNADFELTRKARPDGKGQRHFQFAGSSEAGWSGLKTREYTVLYYDAGGNLLRYSALTRFYDIVEYEDDVTHIRIEGDAPLDITLVDAQVRPTQQGARLLLDNCTFREAAAHCLSNAPNGTRIKGGSMSLVYTVLPSFCINFEDGRDAIQDVVIDGMTFENAFTGYVNFIGTIGAKVVNCTFKNNADNRTKRVDGLNYSISVNDNYNSIVTGNEISNGIVELNRQAQYFGNTHLGGYVEIIGNTCNVHDNDMLNTRILTTTSDTNRSLSYIHDQKLYYTKNIVGGILSDNNHNLVWKDVDVICNVIRDVTVIGYDENSTFEPIILGQNGFKLWANLPITKDLGGHLENFTFTGANFDISVKDYSAESFPVVDMNNVYSEASVGLSFGLPKSRKIDKLKVNGYLAIFASDFESTIISATPTLSFNDLQLTIPEGEFNWTNTGSYVLRTYTKNLNLEITKGIFDLQVATTQSAAAGKFIKFGHLGTTLLDNCTFKSVSAITLDFTNTNIFPANIGDITIIDPIIPDDNFTFVLRSQDKLLFTKSHPLMPVYADNAAALADGYPVGYMYRTATGQTFITY